MTTSKGTTKVWIIVGIITAVSLGGFLTLPETIAKLSYAVESGKSLAAQERLESINDLSNLFSSVAKSLRPSVVSISSIRKVKPAARNEWRDSDPFGRRGPFGEQFPKEFRPFFDDDMFDPFRFELPTPPRGFRQQGTGSGVIVTDDGYVLTNNHVVAGADEVTVRLSDQRELTAKVIGTDKPTDLAVLKIEATGLLPAKLGDSDQMLVGHWVLAMGSPFGLDQTVTVGIVSAKGRANVGITDYEDFIQTDAAINPGNSGGPLVNLRGEVIAINTAIASKNGGNMGVGFAIPSNMARSVMESLIANGNVARGWLGAVIQNLDPELAKSFEFEGTDGVLIGDAVANGPAAIAGLKSGDIIVQYNGKVVKDVNGLRNAVAATKADTDVKVKIYRDGKMQTYTVRIKQLDNDAVAKAADENRSRPVEADRLGIEVETMTTDIAKQLGYDPNVQGAVVTNVKPGSIAATLGIRPKDVIVAAGDKKIDSAATFRDVTKNLDANQGIRLQIMRDHIRRFVFLKIDD